MNKNPYILNEFQEDYFDTYNTDINTPNISKKTQKTKPMNDYTIPAEYNTYLKQIKNDL